MCGISCLVHKTNEIRNELHELYEKSETNIKRRGPDSIHTHTFEINNYTIKFTASVLWLQGRNMSVQPVETERSIFIYNGDIFGGGVDESERLEHGDTRAFLNILETSRDILQSLESVHGPYSFIYFDKTSSRLYFTRDYYGRRSLLLGKSNDTIVVSSVVVKNDCGFIELPTIGVFYLDLMSGKINVIPWRFKKDNFVEKFMAVEEFLGDELVVDDRLNVFRKENSNFEEPSADDLVVFQEIQKLDAIAALQHLQNNNVWNARAEHLTSLLEEAVRKRVSAQPGFCGACLNSKFNCTHCKLGILFSGGLDCSILAVLADKFVDPNVTIDLMNVAFFGPQGYETPDRISGLETLEELRKLRPARKWNFLEINITQEELKAQRDSHIKHLIYPVGTILDDSLGCALWFASRGMVDDYVSPCRVLLVGMGADELFGGYNRHRCALRNNGWLGLAQSLRMDWMDISHRNLARDDRVVSDHGRQLRTPYLDEDVVEYVQGLKVCNKTFPSDKLVAGLGEKILLRSVAYNLGLRSAACLKKRSMQFGSRIADKKEKAHEISPRL